MTYNKMTYSQMVKYSAMLKYRMKKINNKQIFESLRDQRVAMMKMQEELGNLSYSLEVLKYYRDNFKEKVK